MGFQERLKRAINGTPVRAARPVNFNPPTVRDTIHRVLEVGDEVLSIQPNHHLRVASVQHVTSPGAPPNLVEIIFVSRVQVAVPQNASMEGLYFLRHASEIADGFLKNIGAEPAAAVPAATLHLTDKD